MTAPASPGYDLEEEINRWRAYATRRRGVDGADLDELEDHLRSQIDELSDVGLRPDEAFLISVKRLGGLDDLSREYAREHAERLWKQLVLPGGGTDGSSRVERTELVVVLGLAVGAAAAMKLPEIFGLSLALESPDEEGFYLRNASLLILPFLAGYFAWKRSVSRTVTLALVATFAVAALFANIYPFGGAGHTEALTALHLPIVLWAAVGVAYVGGSWQLHQHRMDFIRFSGEWFVYLTLLGLGGGLLMAFTAGVFNAIGVDTEIFLGEWLLPCGVAGAVVVAAWLVEAKQGVIESMAPVLTAIFTPLFSLLLMSFLVAALATRTWIDVDRDVLVFFDLLLVVVFGLLLYSLSARPPQQTPAVSDWLSISLVISALLIDLLVLGAVLGRISEFGFSANKTAALGENLVLLVNLAWAAWLYLRFVGGGRRLGERSRPDRLLEWQTAYIPVFVAWAVFVVVGFPPLFGFD